MVHQYKLNGYNIVLDSCSGSIHVVDDIAYDIIKDYEKLNKEEIINNIHTSYQDVDIKEIEKCYDDVKDLVDNKTLYTKDVFEKYADRYKAKSSGIIKALCLHVAHTCNLNCSYCFASQGKFHGERALMSFETGKRALDF